jgi:hypothetical protein
VIRAADRHGLDHPVTTWLHGRVAARIEAGSYKGGLSGGGAGPGPGA